MRILGKDGLVYCTLAVIIYLVMPLIVLVMIPVMWIYEKVTGKEF